VFGTTLHVGGAIDAIVPTVLQPKFEPLGFITFGSNCTLNWKESIPSPVTSLIVNASVKVDGTKCSAVGAVRLSGGGIIPTTGPDEGMKCSQPNGICSHLLLALVTLAIMHNTITAAASVRA